MDEVVAINVRYEGDNEPSQIFQLHRQTQWRDLEAMLKAQYDCENVEIFYVDTEGDYITISSQEELHEAFKVALQCSNTLHLKLRNYTGLSVDTMEHTENKTVRDTDTKVLIESSVDPCSEPVGKGNQDIPTIKSLDSEAELKELEKWLHEDSRPVQNNRDKKVEIFLVDEMITPSEDEKKETGELKPCDTQRDEETGAVTIKPKVFKHKSRKSEKTGGEHKKRHCKSAERSRKHRYENEAGDTSDDTAMPYEVFTKYMQQLKLELRTEIVRDVTRKTVKQVLKGLDGAVIQSMKGGSSADNSESPVSPTKQEMREPEITTPLTRDVKERADPSRSHPVYYHDHVSCDFCERVIIGARYKCCNCLDYDLCEDCEAIHGVHDPSHVFLKIRHPVRLRNKTPLLKQSIYRTGPSVHLDHREPTRESKEELYKNKLEKLKSELRMKQEKHRQKEEKLINKQKKKEERLSQWFESSKSVEEATAKVVDMREVVSKLKNVAVETLMAADFLYDVTIPDGTRVQPGTRLMKTWRIRNAGTSTWTSSTKLKVVYGCLPSAYCEIPVPLLEPGEEGELSVEFTAPEKPGRYQSHWKLFDGEHSFGHRVWCDIEVEPKEVLEPTKDETFKVLTPPPEQQMHKSEFEQLPDKEVQTQQTEEFLLEPRQTSVTSNEQQANDEENIKLVVADSVAEIADKMVEYVCEKMDKNRSVKQEVAEREVIMDERKPEEVETEMGGEDDVKMPEDVTVAKDNYESFDRSGEESDFNDGQGFLHVRGPDLIAFEMVEPVQEHVDEQVQEQLDNPEETLNERKEEVQIEERQVLSRSSSVEVVNMTQESSDDEDGNDHGYLRSLQNKISENVYDEEEEQFSDSSYDIYNDSEDDFLVVPMPACFNLEKPITFHQTGNQSDDTSGDNFDDNHNMVNERHSRVSVDDILTTSGTIATPPLEPEAVTPPQQESENQQGEEPTVFHEVETGDSTVVLVADMDMVEAVESSETDIEETKVVGIPVLQERLVQGDEEDVVTRQPTLEGATAIEQSEESHPDHRPAELVNQIMHTAVRAANKAAANAYTTAKEVFYTWQARTYQNASGKTSDFKPPASSWKPKENSFKPPKSEWKPKDGDESSKTAWKPPGNAYKPPKCEWKPPSDTWKPPKETGPMGKLGEMGFFNRELNEKLLKKHNDDVEAVVQELLTAQNNDWMEQRH